MYSLQMSELKVIALVKEAKSSFQAAVVRVHLVEFHFTRTHIIMVLPPLAKESGEYTIVLD